MILHHFRDRSWVWGYGHILIFAAIAATGAGLHVVALVVEGEAHLSESAAVLAVAIPVLVFLVALFALYTYLVRTSIPSTSACCSALSRSSRPVSCWPRPVSRYRCAW